MRNIIENSIFQIKNYQYEILCGFCAILAAYLIGVLIKKARSNYPPGPAGLPLVGYLPFLSENVHVDFIELGKKYGDVFSVSLGTNSIVVLHGAEAIKEAFNKPEFLGRPEIGSLQLLDPISPFFSADFQAWKEQRKFVVQSMKHLGLGKTKIEDDVMDEVNHFIEVLKSHDGEPMDVKEPLSPSMSNNICALVFGKRYEYDDKDRQFLDSSLEDINEFISQISLDIFFPWISYIPFYYKLLKVEKAVIAANNIKNFFKKEVDVHLKRLDPEHIQDFVDRYILEIESVKKENSNSTFSYDMLVSNVMDLFGAGSETVRTSILWFIYCMAAFPDVQKRVQREILEVLGSERRPEYVDLKSMPYTHTVIMEIMRWKTIVPLNLMHCTVADTTVGGYDIPKGTIVIANFGNVHHDPRYWKEPEKFKPERFLSEDGKSVVKSSNFMPFSLGKRVCPGESMAYMEMFFILHFDLTEVRYCIPGWNEAYIRSETHHHLQTGTIYGSISIKELKCYDFVLMQIY